MLMVCTMVEAMALSLAEQLEQGWVQSAQLSEALMASLSEIHLAAMMAEVWGVE